MPLTVAIIGAGPAGFYAADALLRQIDGVRIDLIERLPSPYGLVRAGVAPDHLPTKQVSRKFDKIAAAPGVGYFGNVEVGRDIALDDLRSMYDAVVFATGMPHDRPLGIPGADLPGVYGAEAFVGWYNGHPDFADLDPDLNVDAVAVVGNGNVALDIARLLVRSKHSRVRTDMPRRARAIMDAAPITDVYLLGRRGPLEAKFTNVELREMLDLTDAVPMVDPDLLPSAVPADLDGRDQRLAARNLETLTAFTKLSKPACPKRVHFMFYQAPLEVLGTDRVTGLRLAKTRLDADGRAVPTGETYDLPCGLIVAAIGYRGAPIDGLPFDAKSGTLQNDRGRVAPGIYAVGWAMRGPSGVISSSRPDGVQAAERIAEDFPDGGTKPGGAALRERLAQRGVRPVDFAGWQALDAAEISRAKSPEPRHKFTRIDEMLAYLEETTP